jgi:hypothetical protein
VPSSGTRFHSLHATSQALQPMHTEVSVKKPTRLGWSPDQPASVDGSASIPESEGSEPENASNTFVTT